MAYDAGLAAWVEEAMAPLGTVTRKRLFGGATLYCDGVAFAILGRDNLWFKADAESDAAWDAAGAERFTYARGDTVASMNYRRAPANVYDDPDALREWGTLALEAGRRAAVRKKPRARYSG